MIKTKSWPDSSQIDSATYNTETDVLTVTFKRGAIYKYKQVPWCVWDDLVAAESIGQMFNKIIKGHYDYEKVD